VPPTIRDILQCLAERDLYRPVWQEAIEIEVLRNGARLLVKRSGFDPGDVAVTIQRTVGFMHIAFPAARLPGCPAARLPDWTRARGSRLSAR
jgi:hypothetical protein